MDRRIVQRIIAVRDPEETGTLFKRLRAKLADLQKFSSVSETPVCFPVGYNIFGSYLCNAGNILKKRSRSRIQVYADPVYTVFNNAI